MASSQDDEKTREEEAIKTFCQSRAAKKLKKVAEFLERVALDDDYRDTVSVRVKVPEVDGTFRYDYEERKVAISTNIRVTAAKTWKELIADKAIGDIKEKAKAPRREGLDMKAAMEAIARAKQKEREAADKLTEEEM